MCFQLWEYEGRLGARANCWEERLCFCCSVPVYEDGARLGVSGLVMDKIQLTTLAHLPRIR
jgi:hypothetical protein